MPQQITIKIPVIVGSNGKWCANGYSSTDTDGPDWGFMSDTLENSDGSFPKIEQKYFVEATLTVPDVMPETIEGIVTEG